MPKLHQDNSTQKNLERNLRHSRRHNKDVPEWKDYETSEDDPRPIADPKLEFDADKAGNIHVRKSTTGTEFLPGYGTSNFGISGYDSVDRRSPRSLLVAAGLASAGLAWRFRENISSGLGTIATYALLLREASKSE